jgi:hypothetical protein
MVRNMKDALDTVIDDAVTAQPLQSDTGAGIRQELEALTPPPTPTAQTADGAPMRPLISRKGETWDALLHASPPSETARGTWRKLSRAFTAPAGDVDERCRRAAVETCAMAFDTCAPMLDAMLPLPSPMEWQPTDEERDSMERHLARFYTRYPEWCIDLPPGMALALAFGAYALPRVLALPQAQALLSRLLSPRAQRRRAPDVEALRDAA